MKSIFDTDGITRMEKDRASGKFAPVLADFMKAVTDHVDTEYPDAVEIIGDYAFGEDEAYAYRLRKMYVGWVLCFFETTRVRLCANTKRLRYLEAMVVLKGMGIRDISADLYDDQPMPEDVIEGAPKRLVTGLLKEFRSREAKVEPVIVLAPRPSLWARFLAFFQKERAA